MIRKTNFERITENKESLSKFISDLSNKCHSCGESKEAFNCDLMVCVRDMREWLKEKHDA